MLDALDVKTKFAEAASASGLEIDISEMKTGCIGRCPIRDKGKRNRDGAYILHLDSRPAGAFKNWCANQDWIGWSYSQGKRTLTFAERAELKRQQAKQAEEDKKQRQAAQEDAAALAEDMIANAAFARASQCYLRRKGIQPHRAREANGQLLIPMQNLSGRIMNVQKIGDREKLFLPGGRVDGLFHVFSRFDPYHVALAEGWASAASIHEATSWCVLACMSAENLTKVAAALRTPYPQMQLTICGDDDWQKTPNKGEQRARAAARAVGGKVRVLFPKFSGDRKEPWTDFNDLHQAAGLEEVKRQLLGQPAQPVRYGK